MQVKHTVLEFHNLDIKKLVKGEITDQMTKTKFTSKSRLDSKEIVKIAEAAKQADYLESYVGWCKAALEAAKMEHKNQKNIEELQQNIQVGFWSPEV